MRKRLLITTVLLLIGFPAAGLEIIYPAHQTSFVRSNFLILKGGDKPVLEGLTVEINGAKSDLIPISGADYRAAFRDFVILQPEFDPGKNKIVVEGYAGGKKAASAVAEVYYQAESSASAPAGFQPFVMHLPEKEKLCAPCHDMGPEKTGPKASAAGNPCASCHKRMLEKSHVHGPAGVWTCTYCHPADTRPARYQSREGDARVCNECHADKVKEYRTNKFVHGPVEAEMCSACHDPHATDHVAQLLAPVNELCLGCHEEIGKGGHVVRGVSGKSHPLKGVGDPSRLGRELSCTSCHDPHGGAVASLFQRGLTSRFALCQLCHQK